MDTPSAWRRASALPQLAALGGIALFAIMDALMKRAALDSAVFPALLARSLMGAGLVLPLWAARGGRWPAGPVLRIHLLRGVLVAGMATTFFWALVRMPLAEGMALSFVSPLIALWLASAVLGERVSRDSVVAALFGLAGVAVIAAARARGGGETRGLDAVGAILLSALFYACNLILQRRQALVAGPLEVALFQNLVVALVLAPLAPMLWHTPPPGALVATAAAAVLASLALMLLTWAYARAEAQVLVPLEYTAFGWSALMGSLWFSERVTESTLAGLALILLGTWRGTRRTARGTAPAP